MMCFLWAKTMRKWRKSNYWF